MEGMDFPKNPKRENPYGIEGISRYKLPHGKKKWGVFVTDRGSGGLATRAAAGTRRSHRLAE
jgi:hypothetical protein